MASTGPESMECEEVSTSKSVTEPKELSEEERAVLKTLHLESVFVTGANRGLGLEFVNQLVRLSHPPSFVFATYREGNCLEALLQIKQAWSATTNVQLIEMDVTKIEDVQRAKAAVGDLLKDKGLTLLINNAGVAEILYFPQLSERNMETHFDVNTIGPVMVMQEFLPLLQESASRIQGNLSASRAAVLNICAWGASITRVKDATIYDLSVGSCMMSKAALNMAMKIAAHQVTKDGILVVMMCPGWSRTDMGTELADTLPEQSIQRILVTLANLGSDHQGVFMDKFGVKYDF